MVIKLDDETLLNLEDKAYQIRRLVLEMVCFGQ